MSLITENISFLTTRCSPSFLKRMKKGLPVAVIVCLFLFSVIQDWAFSVIRHTGFYLSESALYHTFWLFFIPLTSLLIRRTDRLSGLRPYQKLLMGLMLAAIFTIGHLVVFTLFFVGVSHVVFTTGHRFTTMLGTVLSGQLYITMVWYLLCPWLLSGMKKSASGQIRQHTIRLKSGSKLVTVPLSTVILIKTDRPYSVFHTDERKYFDNRSLKSFESLLDPSDFRRVHRSAIVNLACVKELISRSNGDYDAVLSGGQRVRLSRHYRHQWEILLHRDS